jgi:xanthine dehydrogenase molybdopterin-binding subunit B
MRPEELRPLQERTAADPSDLARLIDREFAVIGQRMRKVDGAGKVTGTAVYADDIVLPGMLHAKILRSPHPHARIVSIDTSRAEALDGVRAVVTGDEMPLRYCVIPWTRDEQALAADKVRFIGDGVAAVAAMDEDTANRALELATRPSPDRAMTAGFRVVKAISRTRPPPSSTTDCDGPSRE